jgi:hypothetical protein
MKLLKNWKIILSFLLVFAAGCGAGTVGTMVLFKRGFEGAMRYENWINKAMEGLQRDLKLTPEQVPKVRVLVEATGLEMKDCLTRTVSDAGGIMARFDQRLDSELTPEQREEHARKAREFREAVRKNLNIELPTE